MSSGTEVPREIGQILAKYPPEHKRSAVMPLLYLAQRDDGYITKEAMQDIADLLDMSLTDVGGASGLLHAVSTTSRRASTACRCAPTCRARCAARRSFLDALCENLGIQVGETTADGLSRSRR